MKSGPGRAWVDIDLGALQRNALSIAARAGVPIVPMVKADAYGLGAIAVARALEPLDPWAFGVATVEEGAELRDAGIERRIVIFTPLIAHELRDVRALSLTPSLSTSASVDAWARLGGGAWHLSVDTGMSRAGVRWDEVATLAATLRSSPPEGAFTHFHSADRADTSMEVQEARFRDAVAALPARPPVLHTENGPAIERRGRSPWDIARPGIFLYGVGSGVSVGSGAGVVPEPVVHVHARVVDIRTLHDGDTVSYLASYRAVGDRRIATLAVGYADGIRRALSNRGSAMVRGAVVPIAGIVTMDMTMLDVTDVPGCEVGDVATLIGAESESGESVLDVASVAHTADLSPYELLTGLRGRLPRQYRGAA